MSPSHYVRYLLIAACAMLAQTVTAAEGIRGNLVSVQWLERNLGRADLLVLDASPGKMHKAQHIPGAVSADAFADGAREIAPPDMERRLQSWGVSPGKRIVIYDQGGTYFATRVFFDLHYHGFPVKNLFVLDGGLAKWQATGLPLSKEPTPAPAKGTFRITRLNENARVQLPEFLTASGDPANHALVEALEPSWHFGETGFFDRAGHVPNGIMLPSEDFFNADKTFKSPDEIRRMLDYLGIRREQQIHAYCGGGWAATVPYFAIGYLLDYPKVKLFRESQMGWLQDDRGLPFWTYSAPTLMRDTNWLKSWGGGILRMYGGAKVSIVDVRPAEAFKTRHIPFAVNVPAEVFKQNLDNPAGLAAALGQAGVDPSHEAVVVSDAALDTGAALAYMMLERAGQKRVSVFMDSIDRWVDLGQQVNKAQAATGADAATKGPGSAPMPPTVYATKVRKDLVIADPKSTQGKYAKVFVASGKDMPTRTPDAKFIHVPYSSLLNADGTPKAAKDIWNILAKAGVPRYAEIVVFADEPGEAAANYYLFKLMGFPDLKVLVL